MILFEDLPFASERMGIIWTLGAVADAVVLEFGPEGTTHYAAAQHETYNGKMSASLYTTGLTEKEVVFGDPGILETCIQEIVTTRHPSHLFVLPSAVSEIIGLDVHAVCGSAGLNSNTRIISLGSLSLDADHTQGVASVLSLLAREVVAAPAGPPCTDRYNIIGSCMDLYNYKSDLKEIQRLMKGAFGLEAQAVFTGGSSMGKIKSASEAAFNLVLRAEGIDCADILEKRFGQPYCHGVPYGIKGTLAWLKDVADMTGISPDTEFIEKERAEAAEFKERLDYHKRISRSLNSSMVLCGPFELLENMGAFLGEELGFDIKASVLTQPNGPEKTHRYLSFKTDTRKYDHIRSLNPDFLLADAVTLSRFKGQIPGFQVANPNLGAMCLYAHTPFMGFYGAQVIIQKLANLLLPG